MYLLSLFNDCKKENDNLKKVLAKLEKNYSNLLLLNEK